MRFCDAWKRAGWRRRSPLCLPDQRQVLIMWAVHGLSGRTVAATLGLSLPTMTSRLHRPRAALHGTLQGASRPAPGGCDG
ncbi:sigma factor-like helix-turn-helix DNA-binding protein [Actinomadura sp. GTD37]|uniref:sigma factor-like helix-turn-helix DNA-binding protein n=1 Tax=Actinomadura sp. GTD37 TaxID=1778030 RepID=UPI0035BF7DB1